MNSNNYFTSSEKDLTEERKLFIAEADRLAEDILINLTGIDRSLAVATLLTCLQGVISFSNTREELVSHCDTLIANATAWKKATAAR